MYRQGRPIYIQLLGKIDISTLKKITTEERMVKFHIQVGMRRVRRMRRSRCTPKLGLKHCRQLCKRMHACLAASCLGAACQATK